jgi:hypothetical protein
MNDAIAVHCACRLPKREDYKTSRLEWALFYMRLCFATIIWLSASVGVGSGLGLGMVIARDGVSGSLRDSVLIWCSFLFVYAGFGSALVWIGGNLVHVVGNPDEMARAQWEHDRIIFAI